MRAGGILEKFKVKVACTTDDPVDSLEYHRAIRDHGELSTVVAPAFRPDRVLDVTSPDFTTYAQNLGTTARIAVDNYQGLLDALQERIQYFHDHGRRLSDHGFGAFPFEQADEQEVADIYGKAISGATSHRLRIGNIALIPCSSSEKCITPRAGPCGTHWGDPEQ